MNQVVTHQVAARDEKWVPTKERVKISTTNVRLEITVPQKEETFQVIIDVIKNSTCYKAFTISAEVPEIFMQQFWYTVKKVKDTKSYEFLLANKKCVVDVEVFQKILDVCPRVQGVDFAELPDDEDTLTFLLSLGYKGPLHKHHSMYVDHMHQPWRTLASIINKCVSGKTASNDKLRKSKINILWGLFYRENVDYLELIWEDFAFQIDYKQLKKGRHENMPYPRFTKIIINHFLSKQQSLTRLQYLHTHTIKDDGVVSRLKFIRLGQDFQEYGLPIPETILTDRINIGKGSHGKKTADTTEATVDVSEELNPEPARKQTTSKRVVEKKFTITMDDNIVPKPDVALELGKSMSLTEAAEEEASRQVHATHARIVTELSPSLPEEDHRKLKGVQTLTPEEQIATDTMKALKESKNTNKRQACTGGSSEGTGVSPGVPDESTVVPTTSGEGTGSEQESEYSKEKDDDETIKRVDTDEEEEKKDDDDDKSIDLELTDDEETDDEFVHGEEHVQDDHEETDDEFVYGDEQVNNDEDEEMTNAEIEESRNGDKEITDAAKVDARITKEVKDDAKKTEPPPTSSSLSVSSGFGNQFLKLPSDTSLIGTSPSILTVPVLVISKPSVLTPIPKTPSVAPATTLLYPPSVSTIPLLRVVKLEKDVSELKKLITLLKLLLLSNPKFQRLLKIILDPKLLAPEPSKIQTSTIDLEPESKKSTSEIRKSKKEEVEKQKMPKYTIKSTDKATLKEYDQKSALYQTMNENKSFNRNPAN
ncbi:hypothetical protein Tco_0531752 [Tanacetum coccineum]